MRHWGTAPLISAAAADRAFRPLQSCWASDPTHRPPFTKVLQILARVHARLTSQEVQWIDAP
jgi:hypothetical protein